MSANTPRFALTYPQDGDPPNAPAQIQDLATDVETRLGYAGAQGGKSIVTAEQTITAGGSYDYAGTHDVVPGVVIENDGDLLIVRFSALVKTPHAGTTRAAIFLGAVQLATASNSGAPAAQEVVATAEGDYDWIYTQQSAGGLTKQANAAGDASEVTTGMTVPGGPIFIERLAAGTYDVSVRWRAQVFNSSIKARRLEAYTKEWPASGI